MRLERSSLDEGTNAFAFPVVLRNSEKRSRLFNARKARQSSLKGDHSLLSGLERARASSNARMTNGSVRLVATVTGFGRREDKVTVNLSKASHISADAS